MSKSIPVLSYHNQYNGINAHLQSKLQQTNGGWSSFHDQHINEIARSLNVVLPPDYYATTEDSMQIKTRSEPDGLVLKRGPNAPAIPARPAQSDSATASEVKSFTSTLEIAETDYYNAVVLYKRTEDGDLPVTRVELLSPSNIDSKAEAYNLKRDETLAAGINVIEINYLNQSHPTEGLQPFVHNYAVGRGEDRHPEATAYHIGVTHPLGIEEEPDKPGVLQVQLDVEVYPFGVEIPIPSILVPLAEGDDPVWLDLQKVYDTHFYDQRWGVGVDYNESPKGMDHYALRDQLLIDARIQAVLDAYHNGAKLDTPTKIPLTTDRQAGHPENVVSDTEIDEQEGPSLDL